MKKEVRIPIGKIYIQAKTKPSGYVEDVLSHGEVKGLFLVLSEENAKILYEKYRNTPELEKPKDNQPVSVREPTLMDMVVRFKNSMKLWASKGLPVVKEETYKTRMEICLECEFWQPTGYAGLGKCLKCGCSGAKQHMATEQCPLTPPKWSKEV